MLSLRLCAFAAVLLSALPASASWVIDVPLKGGAGVVDAFVKSRGGTLQGGAFSGQGWTTTSRNDSIEIPLPAGIDARRGKLTVTFTDPELSGPKGFFESWILVSVDTTGVPFAPTKAGQPGVQTLYVAYNELDETFALAKAYFNLHDPSCTNWKLCTAEGASKKGWLSGAGPFTLEQVWDGPKNALAFTPGGGTKQLDLGATSPAGSISGNAFILSINACGGSKSNACGLWDGPTHGGPLGLTYAGVRLELFDAPSASDAGSDAAPDAASEAAAGGSAGADGGAGSGGSAGAGGSGAVAGAGATGATGGALASGGGGGGDSTDAGCACRVAHRQHDFGLLLASLALLARRLRRGRGRASAV